MCGMWVPRAAPSVVWPAAALSAERSYCRLVLAQRRCPRDVGRRVLFTLGSDVRGLFLYDFIDNSFAVWL